MLTLAQLDRIVDIGRTAELICFGNAANQPMRDARAACTDEELQLSAIGARHVCASNIAGIGWRAIHEYHDAGITAAIKYLAKFEREQILLTTMKEPAQV